MNKMSKKTIYWIVGIIIFYWYVRCNVSILGATPSACAKSGTAGNEFYKYKECSLWRTLGLSKCSPQQNKLPVYE
tara:strand:- start:811 stop:1035 length:225 start_codon:yes stop_codon:yes gene_type:complete